MSNATSPRKRGHAGRAARGRFVELENILPVSGAPPAGGLVIEIDGLRLILADRAAVAILIEVIKRLPHDGADAQAAALTPARIAEEQRAARESA